VWCSVARTYFLAAGVAHNGMFGSTVCGSIWIGHITYVGTNYSHIVLYTMVNGWNY